MSWGMGGFIILFVVAVVFVIGLIKSGVIIGLFAAFGTLLLLFFFLIGLVVLEGLSSAILFGSEEC